MLIDKFGHLDLSETMLPAGQFHPFPNACDRKAWEEITPETKAVWMTLAEEYKDFSWPAIPKDKFLQYTRDGENFPYLMSFFERRSVLGVLTLAECIEGEGRFLEQIINGIYCVCEETAWLTPFDLSKTHEVLPDPMDRCTDLASSETGALLVWISYLLREQLDAISRRICQRIKKEVHDRVIVPYMENEDYWWMGFVKVNRVNNWNPWCNKNVLMYFLLLESDTEAHNAGILKIMRSLDAYLSLYPPDGCCDEGPMYWGAAGGGLHTCLSLLSEASSGKIDIFSEKIVQDIGRYIYKVYIHNDYYVDFADGNAHVEIGTEVYKYGQDIDDSNMVALGAGAMSCKPGIFNWFSMYSYLLDIFTEREKKEVTLKVPYIRESWMWDTQVMTAREREGSEKGFFIAAKGGHNSEAHNHNDIGNFIVYVDGKPLLIDLGTEEYTAKTFSKQRFELWYLQSQYHNCPTIAGILQKDGSEFKTADVKCLLNDSCAELTMDICGAYPEEAGIDSWIRTCRLNRGDDASVEVLDSFVLKELTDDIVFNLITPCEPVIPSPGRIQLQYCEGKWAVLEYDDEHLSVQYEKIEIMGSKLKKHWGNDMYRIKLVEKEPVSKGMRRLKITTLGI